MTVTDYSHSEALSYGGDSAVPQPAFYDANRFHWWGIYVGGNTPYRWRTADIRQLSDHGIHAALPIVVPPTSWPWPMGEEDTLRSLIEEAQSEGVPRETNSINGSILELDLEEILCERMGTNIPSVGSTWWHLCAEAGYRASCYGPEWALLEIMVQCRRRLARWPIPVPTHPVPPPSFHAWQYAGNAEGGAIDLNVARGELVLMATNGHGSYRVNPDPANTPRASRADLTVALDTARTAINSARQTLDLIDTTDKE